jgi:hypothetical protein
VNLYSYTLWQVPCNECPINVGDGTRLAYRYLRMSASGQSFQRGQWLKLGISSSWILRRSISGKWLWPSVSRQRTTRTFRCGLDPDSSTLRRSN